MNRDIFLASISILYCTGCKIVRLTCWLLNNRTLRLPHLSLCRKFDWVVAIIVLYRPTVGPTKGRLGYFSILNWPSFFWNDSASSVIRVKGSGRRVTDSRFDSRTGNAFLCPWEKKLNAYISHWGQAVNSWWWPSQMKDLQIEPKRVICVLRLNAQCLGSYERTNQTTCRFGLFINNISFHLNWTSSRKASVNTNFLNYIFMSWNSITKGLLPFLLS